MGFLDRDKYGMYKHASGKGPGPALMGADTLIGESVVNAQGLSLGDIKEIMLDMRSGEVAYAVLAFGGFLGLGEKLFAVPWQAMQLDTANKCFVLDVDKERLKTAPGFNSACVAGHERRRHGPTQIHTFYGTDPSGTAAWGAACRWMAWLAAPRAAPAPALARRWAALAHRAAAAAVVRAAAPAAVRHRQRQRRQRTRRVLIEPRNSGVSRSRLSKIVPATFAANVKPSSSRMRVSILRRANSTTHAQHGTASSRGRRAID